PANHCSKARTTRLGVSVNPSRSGLSPAQRMRVRTAISACAREGRIMGRAGGVSSACPLAGLFSFKDPCMAFSCLVPAVDALDGDRGKKVPIPCVWRSQKAVTGTFWPSPASTCGVPRRVQSLRDEEGSMTATQSQPAGPDLTGGIPVDDIAEGRMLAGHVGEDAVVLARRGDAFFAIDGKCTHYGGPLAEGLLVGDTVRCPWHHACFSLRTGEALRAPALTPVACWSVEQRDGKVFVHTKKAIVATRQASTADPQSPEKIVIIGAGAAGFAAAERLRREQYRGSIVMLSDEDASPVDRPNLSKDYLAGNAPEEWVPLRPDSFYADNGIDLRLGTHVAEIDVRQREVVFSEGSKLAYDRLLLATGAEAVRLSIPGANQPHVRTLRSLADCRAIIALAKTARRA